MATFLLRNICKATAAVACVLLSVPVLGQTQLSQYQPGVTADGAVYFLPKTVVQVRVLVEKSSYAPGDFASYAQRYLRMNNVPLEPQVAYRVVGIQALAVPAADTTKAFAVKFNARTVAANVTLSRDGRLLGINAEGADDVALPALFTPKAKAPLPDPRQFLNADILACGSKAKMAELTAHEIYDLRENRTLLIKGQADFMPQDGVQMQLMLAQIDEQERALSSLFVGTTVCDTTEHVLTVVPDGSFARQPLFRLSQVHGLTDVDDLSGAPFYVSIDDLKTVPVASKEAAAKTKKKQFESGIYVNVPGQLRVTLYDGIQQLLSAELPAPQFGNVELLSADLFNKRYTTHLWLSPLTGAVERLEAEQPK